MHRALDLLELVADAGRSLAIAELAQGVNLSPPTTHRLCRTLVDRGYLRQLPDRTYGLGLRLVSLGTAANDLSALEVDAVLGDLVSAIGETANLAVLAGVQAEYVAQVPARYAMRMFTEVGRRVDLHSTGVGKALLAQLDDAAVSAAIRRSGLPAYTAHTITSEAALGAALSEIRDRGHAMDEQEQELGVRCVAVPVVTVSLPAMAVSVSGPLTRMTDDVVTRALPLLHAAAARLAANADQAHAGS